VAARRIANDHAVVGIEEMHDVTTLLRAWLLHELNG
jgi:hypothetical protein